MVDELKKVIGYGIGCIFGEDWREYPGLWAVIFGGNFLAKRGICIPL